MELDPERGSTDEYVRIIPRGLTRYAVVEMSGHERSDRRAGERHAHAVNIVVHTHDDAIPTRALNVSRHGLFVELSDPPPLGHAVLLTVKLPSGAFETMATVVRRVDQMHEAPLGMGVELFCLGADAKERWDKFVAALETRGIELETRPPPFNWGGGSTAGAAACFLVAPPDARVLVDFYADNVVSGRTLYVSPAVRKLGAEVLFVLVHPESKQEWVQRAVVVEWTPDHPQRSGVRFARVERDARRAFKRFVGEAAQQQRLATQEGAPLVTAERPKWTEYAMYSPKLAAQAQARDPSAEQPPEELDVIEGELLELKELDFTDKRALFDFNWNAEEDELRRRRR